MKKLIVFLILFLLLFVSKADAILVENGATSVITYFVLRDKTAGTVDTGVTIANIDCYYIEDQAAISSKTDLAAHNAATDAWDASLQGYHCGYGVHRIDWPNAAFDGGVGKRVQLIVIDGDGGAFTEIMEVELSAPVDTVLVGGSTPTSRANNIADTETAISNTGLTVINTTIAAYTSNTSFTLTAGPPDDNALVGYTIIVIDQSDTTQFASGICSAYTTAADTVTLSADPLAAFTFANGDTIIAIPGGRGIDTAAILVDTAAIEPIVTDLAGIDEIADAVRTEPLTSSETLGTIGWYLYKIRQALGLIR